MSNLCKYKDLFGKPNDGIRKYRIFDISLFDVGVVVICSVFISWLFKISLILTLIVIFTLGIVVHRIFCVKTGLDKKLFV